MIVELGRAPSKKEPYENLILGQHELAEVIFRHLGECGNARVLFGHDVAGIAQDEKGVTVDVDTKDGPKQFTAAYLVGADGGRSFVRSAVGVSFDGFTWPQQIVATNVVYPFEKYGYSTGNQIV